MNKKEKAKDYRLRKTYGITLDQYNSLLKKQKNECKICSRPHTEQAPLHVDHDHGTGEIFGLLCFKCNHILVGKERNPDLFFKAYKYLKKGTGWFVPEDMKRPKRKRRKRK